VTHEGPFQLVNGTRRQKFSSLLMLSVANEAVMMKFSTFVQFVQARPLAAVFTAPRYPLPAGFVMHSFSASER